MKTFIGYLLFVATCSCFLSAIAQKTSTCTEYPARFQTQVLRLVFDEKSCLSEQTTAIWSADYRQQLARMDFLQDTKQIGKNITVWLDFNRNVAYEFDHMSRSCTKRTPERSMGKNTLPSNSKLIETIMIGNQMVEHFNVPLISTEEEGADSERELMLTKKECFPVSWTTRDVKTKQVVESSCFANFVPMLSPYVFEMPHECSTSF
eukprot:TRINITY_DN3576_c0_g2_i1.p1 TRINITY_DN3576_c0_g2~~TRINITY_DN3576_c0_g2_i1.p1  ORF type:complete len:206 (-),score=27.92 TRINITY_DN3576_c0_g2_i1:18-635(-)